jgi:galactokinase
MPIQETITKEFTKRFNSPSNFVVRAPGRVNLIGEHTDYNDGFVLPMAIDRALWIALRPREDRRVLLHSIDYQGPADFSLDDFQHGKGWTEYVKGIAWALKDEGYAINGWEGVITGDVPIGAGLSSSAALEMCLARAFWAVSEWAWDGTQMAKLAKKADNQWVGIQSGIMDQMISAEGRQGHAVLIDCRSLDTTPVPLPSGTRVVILDTATRRGLVDSAYNERVAQCQAAAKFFGVGALRDVSLETFEAKASQLDQTIRQRARHIITENDRTLRAAQVMQKGDPGSLGQLMNASHESLRDDYEVSSKELNIMVDLARQQAGCYGARMTGAGFGGCAVALIDAQVANDFPTSIETGYNEITGLQPNIYVCQATNGAELVAGSRS